MGDVYYYHMLMYAIFVIAEPWALSFDHGQLRSEFKNDPGIDFKTIQKPTRFNIINYIKL